MDMRRPGAVDAPSIQGADFFFAMNSLAALFLPAVLLAVPIDPVPEADKAGLVPEAEATSQPPARAPVWEELAGSFRPQEQAQVRIEQRVIIRINPRRPMPPAPDMLNALPQGEITPRLTERKFGKCVPVKAIAGVQADRDNRLLLFLRDRRIVAVHLEKACRAQDFYSGLYVEPNDDGMICVGRDKLHSRSGANCDLDKLRQIVADRR